MTDSPDKTMDAAIRRCTRDVNCPCLTTMPDCIYEETSISIDLEAIEARAAKATAGPWLRRDWFMEQGREVGIFVSRSDDPATATSIAETMVDDPEDGTHGILAAERDAAFIAASRTDIPALCAEVRKLRTELNPATDQPDTQKGVLTSSEALSRRRALVTAARPCALNDIAYYKNYARDHNMGDLLACLEWVTDALAFADDLTAAIDKQREDFYWQAKNAEDEVRKLREALRLADREFTIMNEASLQDAAVFCGDEFHAAWKMIRAALPQVEPEKEKTGE